MKKKTAGMKKTMWWLEQYSLLPRLLGTRSKQIQLMLSERYQYCSCNSLISQLYYKDNKW